MNYKLQHRQQQEFAKADLQHIVQTNARLKQNAQWEQDSRFRADITRQQRGAIQSGGSRAEARTGQCSSRQQLTEQLDAEHIQAAQALSDSSAKRAECRHLLIQQAKQRAEERERERVKAAQAKEVQRYARDSLTIRHLAALQLQSSVSTDQALQRAARATAQQQMRDAELQWQQATIADDDHQAAMQRKELAARYDGSLQHAQELELQIEQRDQTRQQMHAARAQDRADFRKRAAAESLAQQEEMQEAQDAKRHTMLLAQREDRNRRELLAVAAKAEQVAEDEELRSILQNDIDETAKEHARKLTTRTADVAYRQQLEEAAEREAAARVHMRMAAERERAVEDAAQGTASAAIQSARRQQAMDVAASQLQQIAAHQAARTRTHEQKRAEAAALARQNLVEGAVLADNALLREQADRTHWAAVQAQIDVKQQSKLNKEQSIWGENKAEVDNNRLHAAAVAAPHNRSFGYKKTVLY